MITTSRTELAQCPHCSSVFEVSQEELQLAFGAVRCGDCLKIFNASFHRVDLPHSEPQDADAAAETDYDTDLPDHSIPTLHDHPQFAEESTEADSHYEPDPDFESELIAATSDQKQLPANSEDDLQPIADDELVTETRELPPNPPHKTPPRRLLIAAAVILPLLLLGGWFLSGASQQSSHYLVSDIRLAPAADPQKMQVLFTLGNGGSKPLPLPGLNIELLNLSFQPVASQQLTARQLQSDINHLEPGSSHAMTVTVNRPATFVQTARIQAHQPETGL